MSMADAERLYAQWCQLNGPVTPMTVVDLISWVLMDERRRDTTGHRQETITDESYLLKLGYVQERGGWHLGHPDDK